MLKKIVTFYIQTLICNRNQSSKIPIVEARHFQRTEDKIAFFIFPNLNVVVNTFIKSTHCFLVPDVFNDSKRVPQLQ